MHEPTRIKVLGYTKQASIQICMTSHPRWSLLLYLTKGTREKKLTIGRTHEFMCGDDVQSKFRNVQKIVNNKIFIQDHSPNTLSNNVMIIW